MPADDEHDPLDRWLDQQVQPLPPPPGTFELITRRARRRKMRRLAVTLVSAAAVAAAVAIAVPGGLALHLTPTPVNGNFAAGSSPTVHGGTGAVYGSASRDASSTPNAVAGSSASPNPIREPSGPVPANFAPTSVTFVSASLGWVIGQAGTVGKCANANPDICTSIARTDNAGKTWEGGPAPSTTGPRGPTGVSGIRFLDGVNGWAFGPELWATHDAGRTWTKVNTYGQRVTDLEAVGNRAYALFARCTGADSVGFGYYCTSYTLMTTPKGSDQWTPVGSATSGLADHGNVTTGMIALTGTTGYLVAPDGTLYSGPVGGTWQKAGTMPCQPGTPQANGLPAQALIALISPTLLVTVCNGVAASSPPKVYTSYSSGAIWTAAGDWTGVNDHGSPTSLAATADGTIVLATTTGIYLLPSNATPLAPWTPSSATGAQAPTDGFSYVGMTTPTQGVAVPADTSLHEIWMTTDGGEIWAPATPITPAN